MTKRFCDRCGEPAIDVPKTQMQSGPFYSTDEVRWYEVKLDFFFNFKCEPANTRPDLCGKCMVALLALIIQKLESK